MSELGPQSSRIEPMALPQGVHWANWSRKDDTKAAWRQLTAPCRGSFRARFMSIVGGARLPSQKFRCKKGIGYAKVRTPNPGWRGFMFRDGSEWFVTHFAPKQSLNYAYEIEVALEAKKEHMERKSRQQKEKHGRSNTSKKHRRRTR